MKKLFVFACGLFILFFLFPNPNFAARLRCWCITNYDMPYIKRIIELASELGINTIQLNGEPELGGIVNSVDDVLENPKLQQDLNEIIRLSASKGIKVQIWTNEFSNIPFRLLNNEKLNYDYITFWHWMNQKYDSLFKALPQLNGIVMSFGTTQISPAKDDLIKSNLPRPERYASVINLVYQICKSHNRTLFIRNNTWRVSEMEDFRKALDWVPAEVNIMLKASVFDFIQTYPRNPLLGKLAPHPQIIELDLLGLRLGQANLPWNCVNDLKTQLKSVAVDTGIIGACGHIDLYRNSIENSANEINLYAFSNLLENPEAPMEELWKRWIGRRYGTKAIPEIVPALKRTEEILPKIFYTLGFHFLSQMSNLPPYYQVSNTGLIEFDILVTSQWDKLFKIRGEELLIPTTTIVDSVLAEKYEAMSLCRQSLENVERSISAGWLSGEKAEELNHLFLKELTCAKIWYAFSDAIFALRIFRTTPDPLNHDKVKKALQRLCDIQKETRNVYGADFRIVQNNKNPENNSWQSIPIHEQLEQLIQDMELELEAE